MQDLVCCLTALHLLHHSMYFLVRLNRLFIIIDVSISKKARARSHIQSSSPCVTICLLLLLQHHYHIIANANAITSDPSPPTSFLPAAESFLLASVNLFTRMQFNFGGSLVPGSTKTFHPSSVVPFSVYRPIPVMTTYMHLMPEL